MAKSCVIQLSSQQLKQLLEHAKNEAKYEVCGLIGGYWKPYDRLAIAAQVEEVPNVADDRRNQYRMDEQVQVKLMSRFGARGMELVGIYHSHPNGPAYPSPTDIAEATYPDTVYLILSPYDQQSSENDPTLLMENEYRIGAWRMRRGKATTVEIVVVEEN